MLKKWYYYGWLDALTNSKNLGGDEPVVSKEEEEGYIFQLEVLLAEAEIFRDNQGRD